MLNDLQLRTLFEKVDNAIQDCLDIEVEKYDHRASFPQVKYDLKGHTAGQAFLHHNKIRLNLHLLEKYQDKYIQRTVVHEMGHLIASRVFKARGHGHVWKRVMRALGGPTSRCHSYETKAARKTTKHECHCDRCGYSYQLGTVRVNRIKRGSKYTHPGCGGKVVIGKAPSPQMELLGI